MMTRRSSAQRSRGIITAAYLRRVRPPLLPPRPIGAQRDRPRRGGAHRVHVHRHHRERVWGKGRRRASTRGSGPSWSCSGAVGSGPRAVCPLSARGGPRFADFRSYLRREHPPLPSLFVRPIGAQRERRRVVTRASRPSWSCLGVVGASISSAQRPRRTTRADGVPTCAVSNRLNPPAPPPRMPISSYQRGARTVPPLRYPGEGGEATPPSTPPRAPHPAPPTTPRDPRRSERARCGRSPAQVARRGPAWAMKGGRARHPHSSLKKAHNNKKTRGHLRRVRPPLPAPRSPGQPHVRRGSSVGEGETRVHPRK